MPRRPPAALGEGFQSRLSSGFRMKSADRVQLESGALDLCNHERLIDSMQRLGVGGSAARARRVIDDEIRPARAQRAEHRAIHAVAVGAHPHGVVIEEHDVDAVEVARLRRERIVQLAIDADDIAQGPPLQAIGPRFGGELLQHEAVVLGEQAALLAHRARHQLRRVAAARAELAELTARRDFQEGEQLLDVAAGVEHAIGVQAILGEHDLANERRDARVGDADHGLLRLAAGGRAAAVRTARTPSNTRPAAPTASR